MTIPPQSVPSWTALFGGCSYSAWALLAYSCERVYQSLVTENKQKEVPRFFYNYTNGAFGANFPKETKLHEKVILISTKSVLM